MPGELLADPDALPWTCFWIFSGRERLEQRGARLGDGRLAEVDVERQRARRLLGLDDGLHRERQLAVEAEPVVEHRAEERPEGVAERVGLAVDQVLAGEPVDVVAEAGLVELLGGLAEGQQPVADARDVDLLDRVDQPEQVDPLLRVELADEAEVEEDDLLRDRVGEDVARMRVAVEEAVDQDLLDDRPDEDGPELGRCRSRRRGARRPSRS